MRGPSASGGGGVVVRTRRSVGRATRTRANRLMLFASPASALPHELRAQHQPLDTLVSAVDLLRVTGKPDRLD